MASDGIRAVLVEATPRPWFRTGIAFRIREGVVERAIGHMYGSRSGDAGDPYADAELVVRAVNEHEVLLDVEEQTRKALDAWLGNRDPLADFLCIEKHFARLDAVRAGSS